MIDYKYVIKKEEDWYIVDVDINDIHSGYGVVPKAQDPWGKYDIDDVRAYCILHPEKVLTKHPLEDAYLKKLDLSQQLQDKEVELKNTNNEIFSLVSQDYFNRITESTQFSVTKEDVINLFTKKADIENSITDIKNELGKL